MTDAKKEYRLTAELEGTPELVRNFVRAVSELTRGFKDMRIDGGTTESARKRSLSFCFASKESMGEFEKGLSRIAPPRGELKLQLRKTVRTLQTA